jgi:hypothetical protein
MVLRNKDRQYDGGRETEFYEFQYRTDDYNYMPIRITDYHMSKNIEPFNKNEYK